MSKTKTTRYDVAEHLRTPEEMAAYLAGEITCEEAVEAIKVGTRHFAKRQLTWYRKMPYIHWYEPESQTQSELLRMILTDMAGFLQE